MSAQDVQQALLPPTTLSTMHRPSHTRLAQPASLHAFTQASYHEPVRIQRNLGDLSSTVKGIMIGIFSVLGAAGAILIVAAVVYYFRYTQQGRIFLDRLSRPGEYDDEQQFAKEEAEALEDMDDLQRIEYLRAKGAALYATLVSSHGCQTPSCANKFAAFVQANPPESVQTDISLSQFLAIQEKGVSAWEFEPELEIANCFVEGRTEIEFFDSECSVQSNLPIPKQNEVYYWEAKIYDKPDSTSLAIGVTTKPYPLFRLPGGFHVYDYPWHFNSANKLQDSTSPR